MRGTTCEVRELSEEFNTANQYHMYSDRCLPAMLKSLLQLTSILHSLTSVIASWLVGAGYSIGNASSPST
jgi:hypothetical protein